MKLTEVTIKFDNEDSFEYRSAEGFDLGNIFGSLGLTSDNPAEEGTWQAALVPVINILAGVLMKRIGL